MRYALVLLTHGEAPTLEATLTSFERKVSPAPSEWLACLDGASSARPPGPWRTVVHPTQRGFCASCRSAWRAACYTECEFVFWLENDFVFEQPIDLEELATPLRLDPLLAQMALLRQPVSPEEISAGGVVELHRARGATFELHRSGGRKDGAPYPRAWLRHRAYFTTNPSLMRRSFMIRNPWPDYESECEGRFGLDLVARGYAFGIYGDGTPSVRHIGTRTGFGY